MSNSLHQVVLSLKDGTSFKGWSFFEFCSCYGEVVFNTGMTGYQEVISDPSYSGQMVVFTYPEIGNTGLNQEDLESNFIHVKSIVAKNISHISSNWRSQISLKDYLIIKKIPHIFGIDTRALTKHLVSSGVMCAFLFSSKNKNSISSDSFKSLDYIDLPRKVTSTFKYGLSINNIIYSHFKLPKHVKILNNYSTDIRYKIVVLDFGLKFNILRSLLSLNCDITVLPIGSSYEAILQCKPDGILLSNGPGNPLYISYAISLVKKLINYANIPIFGICMGHQIFNLAFDLETFKLKFGHRGLNHPSGVGNYAEITSQNHGFAVDSKFALSNPLSNLLNTRYMNLNDSTISVTCHKKLPMFSVQYHPEASPGPHDSQYLFQIFIELIGKISSIKHF